MPADWAVPVLTTDYVVTLSALKDRDIDALTLLNTAGSSNLPTGAVKLVRTPNIKFQDWDGAAFVDRILSIAGGGTGATTATGARTALGLGDMALQNANAIAITGGTITGLTTLSVNGSSAFNSLVTFAGAQPEFRFSETDGPSDEKKWRFLANVGAFSIVAQNDAESAETFFLTINRTGITIDDLTLNTLFKPDRYHIGASTTIAQTNIGSGMTLTPGTSGVINFTLDMSATTGDPIQTINNGVDGRQLIIKFSGVVSGSGNTRPLINNSGNIFIASGGTGSGGSITWLDLSALVSTFSDAVYMGLVFNSNASRWSICWVSPKTYPL